MVASYIVPVYLIATPNQENLKNNAIQVWATLKSYCSSKWLLLYKEQAYNKSVCTATHHSCQKEVMTITCRWVDSAKVYSQDILLLKSYKLQVMGTTSYGNYNLLGITSY